MSGPDMARFGTRVLRLRTARGWSLRDLAAKSGVGFNTISRMENGKDSWLSSAAKVAAALGASLDDLLREPACAACDGFPPSGFTCNSCGASGNDPPALALRDAQEGKP